MAKEPLWLSQIKEFCRSRKITVMAWGPSALVVEAKSPERRQELSQLFAQIGFQAVPDEDDAYAGILTLSKKDSA
jgi:hypothetical protein